MAHGRREAGRLLVKHIAPADRAEAIERVMRESAGAPSEPHYTFNGLRADNSRFPAFSQVVSAMPFDRATAEVDFIIDMTALRLAEEERDPLFTLSNYLLCIAGSGGYFKRLNSACLCGLCGSATLPLADPQRTSRPAPAR